MKPDIPCHPIGDFFMAGQTFFVLHVGSEAVALHAFSPGDLVAMGQVQVSRHDNGFIEMLQERCR